MCSGSARIRFWLVFFGWWCLCHRVLTIRFQLGAFHAALFASDGYYGRRLDSWGWRSALSGLGFLYCECELGDSGVLEDSAER
jgi:predicted ferric reductase